MIDVALVALLRLHAGVDQKVYSGGERVETTVNLPKVVYTLLGDGATTYVDDGNVGLVEGETCQLDAFAARPSAARLILDNIRVALDGYSGEIDGTKIDRIHFGSRPAMQGPEQPVGQVATAARYTLDMSVDYRERIT